MWLRIDLLEVWSLVYLIGIVGIGIRCWRIHRLSANAIVDGLSVLWSPLMFVYLLSKTSAAEVSTPAH